MGEAVAGAPLRVPDPRCWKQGSERFVRPAQVGVGESVGGAPLRATESLRVPDSPPLRSAEFDRNRAEVDALHRELRMVAALEV